ncbi:MAG: phytoene desaturase family protein [Candidatus Caldarchaeales archaeon]
MSSELLGTLATSRSPDDAGRGRGKRVVVVGAGLGGLAAAALLARDGHEVTVIEKNEWVGGRAGSFSRDGFTFDTGPTWYLMPDVFEQFFAQFGRRPEDFYRLHRLDPSYRVFFDDGTVIDVSADIEEVYGLFDELEDGGGEKLRRFLGKCGELYASIRRTLYLDLDSPPSLLNREVLSQGMKVNVLESVESFVKRHFSSDKARKILLYSIGFVGTPPSRAPSFYAILNYVKLVQGVYYPEGGVRKVVEAVYGLAREHGVEFVLGREVRSLEISGGRVRRVIADGASLEADAVVVNADYAHFETEVLEPRYRTYDLDYWNRRTFTPSALIAFVGVRGKLESLVNHNVVLERDWGENFSQIFDPRAARWPDYASYYVHVPSKTDPSAAPREGEALFILVPVPAGLRDGEAERERLYSNVLRDLERRTGEEIADRVAVRRLFSVSDFVSAFNSFKGSALGLAHTLGQTAFWRPRHRSRKVRNLYYTGQYTHPGIGLPMVLISAEIVRRKVAREVAG